MKLQKITSQIFSCAMVSILLTIFCSAQTKIHNQSALTAKQQKIIQTLIPDNSPDERQLKKFKRTAIVTALKVAQRDTFGREAANYAFLLACLHENYAANKARLLTIASSCLKYKPNDLDYECDEDAAWYLHKLYLKGDDSIVKPLFGLEPRGSAALSQTLGVAYEEIIAKDTILYLQTLSIFSLAKQKNIIELTIRQDGSCSPQCLPLKTRKLLQRIAGNHHYPFQKAARLFVREMSDPQWKATSK